MQILNVPLIINYQNTLQSNLHRLTQKIIINFKYKFMVFNLLNNQKLVVGIMDKHTLNIL